MTPKQQALIEALKGLPHVEDARMAGNHRVMVAFPRERGGRSHMTIPEAKALIERLSVR